MRTIAIAALLCAAAVTGANATCDPATCAKDFPITYANGTPGMGSTHEITFNRKGGKTFWVTAPNYDIVAEISAAGGERFHRMPAESGPHGIVFDAAGRLFVTLEKHGSIVELDPRTGAIKNEIAVNADPHGLGVAPDGKTLWFTAKMANLVGKISSDGTVQRFTLPHKPGTPIYIAAGPDGNMWFTELEGSKIGRVTADGKISEFDIPTKDSRPIAIVPDPRGQGMWFSEEAGNKVAHIDAGADGRIHITELVVPKQQDNVILAGLAFDSAGNLWTQQYVDQNKPGPPGPDHIVMIDKAILNAGRPKFTFYKVPTEKTVMHRIIEGPDKAMWFTELKSDRVGRVDRRH